MDADSLAPSNSEQSSRSAHEVSSPGSPPPSTDSTSDPTAAGGTEPDPEAWISEDEQAHTPVEEAIDEAMETESGVGKPSSASTAASGAEVVVDMEGGESTAAGSGEEGQAVCHLMRILLPTPLFELEGLGRLDCVLRGWINQSVNYRFPGHSPCPSTSHPTTTADRREHPHHNQGRDGCPPPTPATTATEATPERSPVTGNG